MTKAIFEFDTKSFTDLIHTTNSFVLTTHVKPDGDALGSEIGLAEWLLSLGKSVKVFNHSETPSNYHFLDDKNPIIEVFDKNKHEKAVENAESLFLVDTNDPNRAKSLEPYFEYHPKKALIDHHLDPKKFADYVFIDTEATSTGEMMYRLITEAQKELGGTITQKAAQALYAAIMTDTGSFRFPRTDSDVFRICAELIDLGADPVLTYDKTYNQAKPSRLKLIGRTLDSLRFYFDERLALQVITQEDLNAVGADEEEVDGFVQFPLQIETVEFSIFVIQLKEGWKVSFRSKGKRSAQAISIEFGGNGHFHAAGARVYEKYSWGELKTKLIASVERQLS
jgi:bifunctional oligoribonuclease and PAP phosphatase NrnA